MLVPDWDQVPGSLKKASNSIDIPKRERPSLDALVAITVPQRKELNNWHRLRIREFVRSQWALGR